MGTTCKYKCETLQRWSLCLSLWAWGGKGAAWKVSPTPICIIGIWLAPICQGLCSCLPLALDMDMDMDGPHHQLGDILGCEVGLLEGPYPREGTIP